MADPVPPSLPSPDVSDAADSEPSAAAKVFAIPELVEHILVLLAESSIPRCYEDDDDAFFLAPENPTDETPKDSAENIQTHQPSDSSIESYYRLKYDTKVIRFFQPLKTLAAIRRVCMIFNDTVKTSHKIQKLLHRPMDEGVWSKHEDILRAMKWLVRIMMGLRGDIGYDTAYYISFRNLDTTVEGLREKFQKFQQDNERASWRGIKILRVEDSEIDPEDSFMAAVNFQVIYSCETGPCRWKNLQVYFDQEDFEDDVTLGQLSDRICEVLTRSGEDHQKCKDEDDKRDTRSAPEVVVQNLQGWMRRMMETTDEDPRLVCLLLIIWILAFIMGLIAMHFISQVLPDPQSFLNHSSE